MSRPTVSSMHDARDEDDRRLLEAGDHAALVKNYYETIIQRCYVCWRTRDDAIECAQAVAVRLLSELKRGKPYSVPYRVVVHNVIEWTTKGFYEPRRVASMHSLARATGQRRVSMALKSERFFEDAGQSGADYREDAIEAPRKRPSPPRSRRPRRSTAIHRRDLGDALATSEPR